MRFKLTIYGEEANELYGSPEVILDSPTFEMLTEKYGAWERANLKNND